MNDKTILALDLGTTSNRAVLYDRLFKVLATSQQEFAQYFPHPGWVEHDAQEIWESVLQILSELDLSQVSVVGITNQRETIVAWDKRTGLPLAPAIVWQCRRSAQMCDVLRGHDAMIKAKTGLPLDPYFSATKISWLLQNSLVVQQVLSEGRLLVGTIDSWILWKLTGGRVHATDVSNASRTMLMGLSELDYDDALLRLFGIPREILPEIKSSDACFGMTDRAIVGFEAPIGGILGDQQAALFSQCGESEGWVKTTYGTGLFVVTPLADPIVSSSLITTVAWERNNNRWYALEGSIFTGGSLIQWLRDQCKWIDSAEASETLANTVSSSDGVVIVPAWAGLGAPYWDSQARGAILGVTRGTSSAHITRAALEAIAIQVADVVDVIKRSWPQLPMFGMRVDGGGTHNTLLMQLQANYLDMPVDRAMNGELTALGVAGLSAIAQGLVDDTVFRESITYKERLMPERDHFEKNVVLDQYRRAVALVRAFGDQ